MEGQCIGKEPIPAMLLYHHQFFQERIDNKATWVYYLTECKKIGKKIIADVGIGSNIHPTPARVSESLPAG